MDMNVWTTWPRADFTTQARCCPGPWLPPAGAALTLDDPERDDVDLAPLTLDDPPAERMVASKGKLVTAP